LQPQIRPADTARWGNSASTDITQRNRFAAEKGHRGEGSAKERERERKESCTRRNNEKSARMSVGTDQHVVLDVVFIWPSYDTLARHRCLRVWPCGVCFSSEALKPAGRSLNGTDGPIVVGNLSFCSAGGVCSRLIRRNQQHVNEPPPRCPRSRRRRPRGGVASAGMRL